MKSVPDGTTRPTMLTYGATDLAYVLDGPEAEAVKRDPRLELVGTRHASILWVEFADQRDPPKSPSHDTRLRMSLSYALGRRATSKAACLIYRTPGR